MSEPEIRREIEETRERLGGTVDELVAKADVKARARDKAAEVRARAQDKAAEVKATAQNRAGELPGQVKVARAKAVELSGRMSQSRLVQRGWPLAVAAGVAAMAFAIVWGRRQAWP